MMIKKKHINLFLSAFAILTMMAYGCSSPKKSSEVKAAPTVTKEDMFKGGTSFDNALVIRVRKESEGLREEYRWLKQSYPGYSIVRRTKASNGNRRYHLVTFKTRSGVEKVAYFDVTAFEK